jgi:hypothetical protein
VNDLRPHYISLPKAAESELTLMVELQQAREELIRAKTEIEQLKSTPSVSMPHHTMKMEVKDQVRADLPALTNNMDQNGQRFEILSKIDLLVNALCLEYSTSLGACIVAGDAPNGHQLRNMSVVYPTYHKITIPPSSHSFSHGLTLITQWKTSQPTLSYVPLFSMPITCIAVSPFQSDLVLVASTNGSLKVVRLSLQEWKENGEGHTFEALTANVLVELFIGDGESPISALCWDVTSPSIAYAATGSFVRAFELGTGKATYELDIAINEPRITASDEGIFSLISLPPNLDSESPRLLIGAKWGIYHILLSKDQATGPWKMSEAIVALSEKLDWFSDSSGLLPNHPDFTTTGPYWNLLKPLLSSSPQQEEEPSPDNFLFICGYQTDDCQKYFTFDLRLNSRADVPAPMCPIIFDCTHRSPGYLPGSACFVKDGLRFFLVALALDTHDIIFIEPKAALQISGDNLPQKPNTSLLSRSATQSLFDCQSWKLAPIGPSEPKWGDKIVLLGLSSSSLFIIASQRQNPQ